LSKNEKSAKRSGKLSVPLPFDDALKAALETRPPPKKRPKRSRKPPPS
jgi:hypothetical protein